ncbi:MULTISPECIES: anthranilate phosphoribosyltransferase [Chromobacterium]|uniref:Anthranilate phosphoribosyltransferase n=2 Tax=Chromobacterium TaxID=535 RepID=A0ABS3GKS8_9NEIS|nr:MULTISPECIES: anthranilate phosphoribosyltransferase [Chromobacterium]AXT46796.1 anthranilate phosphoribosyltransferase [Chromobacterium rhizoryzae]MBK0414273.1 anthranilate phosphoribosyltransferase [Chromobacterium haemolyticum]MBO0415652.1 anthranilate phosphoribosyltransferase [Chromobacterium haemolyticum]MBO0498832.1 anthranilate phosphoribosyltransferase [Chromobacterium haemolyticum]MDH0341060.1 anthranilate phosphoribosyltransferase [Chromobacterium haemolyticum]
MITPQAALNRLIDGNELFYDEMLDLMRQIMRGELTPAQTAAILIGLRVKVESVLEIAAAATVMREFATPVPISQRDHLVDTCGTGGDKSHTFNISTTSAFVAAAAGARVAKHGGRSVSSSSGSADVLESLGVKLSLSAEQVGRCVDEIGIGFMFAPNHHTAMRHVAPIRKELGARTIFNILGPLTNPADAENQLMGVFHPDLVGIQARVLKQLGSRHALIVHGLDGLDELTLSGPSMVAELKNGQIEEYQLDPRELGLDFAELKQLRADTAAASRDILLAVLDGQAGPARDIVCLNAAAAIYTAGVSPTLADGVTMAREALDSGQARAKLDQLISLSAALAA